MPRRAVAHRSATTRRAARGHARGRRRSRTASSATPRARFGRLVPRVPAANPPGRSALLLLAMELGRLEQLYALLEQARRYDTVVELLRQRVGTESDPRLRASLYRRMARTLAGPLEDEPGAEHAFVAPARAAQKTTRRCSSCARARCSATTWSCSAIACSGSPRSSRTRASGATCSTNTATCCTRGSAVRRRRSRVLRAVIEQLDPDFEPALDELLEAAAAAADPTTRWPGRSSTCCAASATRSGASSSRAGWSSCTNAACADARSRAARARPLGASSPRATPSRTSGPPRLLAGTERHAELLVGARRDRRTRDDPAERGEALLAGAELAYRSPGRRRRCVGAAAAAGQQRQRARRSAAVADRVRRRQARSADRAVRGGRTLRRPGRGAARAGRARDGLARQGRAVSALRAAARRTARRRASPPPRRSAKCCASAEDVEALHVPARAGAAARRPARSWRTLLERLARTDRRPQHSSATCCSSARCCSATASSAPQKQPRCCARSLELDPRFTSRRSRS